MKEFVPDFFLLENVDLGDGDDPDSNLSHIVEMLESCHYRVRIFKVSALEYGLPQRRVRIYIAGFHSEKQPTASFTRMEKILNLIKLRPQTPDFSSLLEHVLNCFLVLFSNNMLHHQRAKLITHNS